MIDLDAIEAEIDDAICCADGQAPIQCSDAKEILARLRQSEKDAARYRWLRDESAFAYGNAPLAFFTDTNGDQITFDFDGSSYSVLHDEMLDAAIDEAMQCNK